MKNLVKLNQEEENITMYKPQMRETVSYTHLDVYKRQRSNSPVDISNTTDAGRERLRILLNRFIKAVTFLCYIQF